ncbi:Uracil-DNA glycosylase [Buchnera aphidicola (Cinara cf. splendens/pseudotsugae 3390)]|uniref:Uracil-DNA glycosylase n=1 Tax=Buchnera aphidicola (Cinara cf. splendens/pseudotsugae 3390) TaxID=2518980 RepID=A0A451CWN2_9GAMM|nr:Uracil-DNA glycosylase [Buchnera aphidicola (Cinara cf. splendens/pseudotsugae 3390)]
MVISSNYLWSNFFFREKKKKYFIHLWNTLQNIQKNTRVYPPKKDIFNAFLLTPISEIKVVIIGQDPYCRFGQANGLSFSVSKCTSLPASLKNIFIELQHNFPQFKIRTNGCLKSWSRQGVFLLNSILTVSDSLPGSHKGLGWEIFTNQVIKFISDIHVGIIFVLWGSLSSQKYHLINKDIHFILRSSHPSPLSCHRGFFGCKHFLKINTILMQQNKKPINWFRDT